MCIVARTGVHNTKRLRRRVAATYNALHNAARRLTSPVHLEYWAGILQRPRSNPTSMAVTILLPARPIMLGNSVFLSES